VTTSLEELACLMALPRETERLEFKEPRPNSTSPDCSGIASPSRMRVEAS
jgi:hypothetical protein